MSEENLPEAAVFIAASLDGYIAREDGSLDWLPKPGDSEGGDYGYADFMATIDTVVMGRKTFEQVLSFDLDAWPYAGKRFAVLSSGSPAVPDALQAEVYSLEPANLLRHLGETGTRRVYVDGGDTIQRFLRARLIQEMIITWIPVLIGSGRPLFGDLSEDMELEHVETQAFSNGLVQSRYRVVGA